MTHRLDRLTHRSGGALLVAITFASISSVSAQTSTTSSSGAASNGTTNQSGVWSAPGKGVIQKSQRTAPTANQPQSASAVQQPEEPKTNLTGALSAEIPMSCAERRRKRAEGAAALEAATGRKEKRIPHPLEVAADSPIWERYLSGGEKYSQSGDRERAKAYYFQALTELEKSPPPGNEMTAGMSRLEHHILSLYPRFRKTKKVEGHGASQIKRDEEEIAVFERLNRLNAKYRSHNDTWYQVLSTQIKYATEDLNKNKEEMQQSGATTRGGNLSTR